MEHQQPYQGPERRQSQSVYEGEDRRKAEPASAQSNADGQEQSRNPRQAQQDDIH